MFWILQLTCGKTSEKIAHSPPSGMLERLACILFFALTSVSSMIFKKLPQEECGNVAMVSFPQFVDDASF